jgi:transcriptional regulator with XRE-family HTH domain
VFTPVAKALQVKFIVVRSSRWLNYIGEVERGEKTAAADIILKIAAGLKIPTRELLKEV